jgi:hypothetical protein
MPGAVTAGRQLLSLQHQHRNPFLPPSRSNLPPHCIGDKGTVLLGKPTVFNKANIDSFDF